MAFASVAHIYVNEIRLLYAAEKGSLEGIELALKEGADIDFDMPDANGITSTGTALYVACVLGHVDVVRLLLRKGASVVKRTKGSSAPLHAAAKRGLAEVVDLLVNHGATVDIRDGLKNTPLMIACSYKCVAAVRRLIELGARPDLIDGNMAKRLGFEAGNLAIDWCDKCCDESIKLIQEARMTKLLRCCNPKCGKPGYRKTLKLCARCKLTRYCSRDCQAQHWLVGHKKCCGRDAYSDEGQDPFKTHLWLNHFAEHLHHLD